MKVIRTDNYDRELFDDVLIADNLSEGDARALADKMNKENKHDAYWYIAVKDDYKLFERDY